MHKVTMVDKYVLSSCLESLEEVLHAQSAPTSSVLSPPLSPPPSHSPSLSSSGLRFSTSLPLPCAARTLFIDLHSTPTKLLDVARN